MERRCLQVAIALGCCVPIGAGLSGIVSGTDFLSAGDSADLNSHFRYLSGLLLGIGVGFLTAIPRIEQQTARVRLLTGIIVIGGIARLYGVMVEGIPSCAMQFGLAMELVITPLLCVWQARVARRFNG